jgi:hypothetical protein
MVLAEAKRVADKKKVELLEREAVMHKELESCKEQFEAQLAELNQRQAKDKETLLQKVQESESRTKQGETRRASLMHDIERDRVLM